MGAMTKRRHHMQREKKRPPFLARNAELKNTALKRRDGCSMTGCMTDCNYAFPLLLSHQNEN